MEEPVLSIIVPVYNVEYYLVACIESIINQSFSDFELLLIDDGSTDDSGKICDEYAKKDKRIVVIHQQNGGLSSARNAGLDIALGKYISFIDSDDEIEQNTYLSNIRILNQNPDIDILQFPTYWNYKTSNATKKIVKECTLCGEEEIFSNWWRGDVITASAWNKIYNKEVFNNIRFPEGHVFEDLYLVVDYAKTAKKIYISEFGCYYYYVRKNSISNSTYSLSKNLDLYIGQFKVYRELCSFDSLSCYKVTAFSRIYRRLLTTKKDYIQADLHNYLDDLRLYIPTWNDIRLSKDRSDFIWIFFVKILGLSIFMFIYYKYIRLKESLFKHIKIQNTF